MHSLSLSSHQWHLPRWQVLLETLSKPLDLDDLYNLALSYESMGEFPQALNYYEQGLDASDGEQRFKFGIKRVKR